MEDMNQALGEVGSTMQALQKQYPELMSSFGMFMKKVESGGALSMKTKELISVALSVSAQCKWCISMHVKSALELGATREEIMEAAFVSVLMGGGPSLMQLQVVMKAVDDLSEK